MTLSRGRLVERLVHSLGSIFRRDWRHRSSARFDLDSLAELFAALGCPNPEDWARSQVDEGINQLGRFLFIRNAWAEAVPYNSTDWIDNVLKNCPARTPSGAAWRRLLNAGADREDLARIVRDAQGELIFGICRLLDGPAQPVPGLPDFRWGLFEIDPVGRCASPISFVHENVLELDPALAHRRVPAGHEATGDVRPSSPKRRAAGCL